MVRARITPYSRICCDCGSEFRPNHNVQMRCHKCGWGGVFPKIKARAHTLVWHAVRKGVLPSLKDGAIACADCGKAASYYDHRDYRKPLDVEPVCPSCNYRRGPAAYGQAMRPDLFPAPEKGEVA